MPAVDAMWNADGALVTATTEAPDRIAGRGGDGRQRCHCGIADGRGR